MYFTEQDVERVLDMPLAVETVEEAFRRLGGGEAENVPRARVRAPGIVLHTMSAAAGYLGLVGWKFYTTTRQGAKFLVGLVDSQSGSLVALIEADRLGQLRTGATTGVAVRYLSPHDAGEVGLFGAGKQARTQLAAVKAVRPIRRAFVYCRTASARQAFAQECSSYLGIEVIPVDRPREAAEELPLVITATNSPDPVFDGHWLSEGALVAAVGSNWLNRAELDDTVIRRADAIVCDDVECCRREAGDFVAAHEKGLFDWSKAASLADVVAGRVPGRRRNDSIVMFKSVGMAVEDVALGARFFERARKQGLGIPFPWA